MCMGINLGDGFTGRHWSTFVQVTDPVTGVGKDDFYNNDFAGFVEDSWKVRPNLTLNLGVRYDLFLIPQPPKPNLATPLTALYTSTINIPKNQFAPRLGMAWEMRKGTVLRLGYGMFYAKTSNSTYYATRVENGSFQQTYNCTTALLPHAGISERDLHASGRSASRAVRGRIDAARHPHHVVVEHGHHARTGSRLGKSVGTRRRSDDRSATPG